MGFVYAPVTEGLSEGSHSRFLAAARGVEARSSAGPAGPSLADAAVVQLLAGRIARAVSQLEQAAKDPGATAQVWSDLAAAYLVRSEATGAAYDLLVALDANREALRRDPDLPEALFNRGLLLESLFARSGAREAWSRYLLADPNSAWADEARERIQLLEREALKGVGDPDPSVLDEAVGRDGPEAVQHLVSAAPQAWRLHLEEDLLEALSGALEADTQDRARRLRVRARAIAEALERRSGDRMGTGAVRALAGAEGIRGSAVRRGHTLHAQGLAAYRRSAFEEASERFEAARSELSDGGSPFAGWAELQLAICEYQLKAYDLALGRLVGLRERAERKRFRALAARAAWITGLVHAVRSDPIRAGEEYERAAAGFAALGEVGNLAAVTSLWAGNLHFLGEHRLAWQKRLEALEAASEYGDPDRLSIILGDTARTLASAGEPEVALVLQDEALTLQERTGDATGAVEALWWRATILHHLDRDDDALRDLEEARALVQTIPSPGIRGHFRAGLAATEGAIWLPDDPDAAAAAFGSSLEYFRRHAYDYLTTEILLQRARAHLALGDVSAAEADLEAGIVTYEEQRLRMGDAPQRLRFFDRAEAVFEEMVRLQIERNQDPAAAFVVADRSRSRALLDHLEGELWRSASEPERILDRLAAALGDESALVAYTVLWDRLLAWSFHRGQLDFQVLPLTREETAARAQEVVDGASRQGVEEELRTAASKAYLDLVAPLVDPLPEPRRLVFIPDGELAAVPFAVLLQEDGRFLIEDHEVLVVPSAASLIALTERLDRVPEPEDLRALVMGAPRLPPIETAKLPDLPGAAVESREVAALYPGATLLLGPEARRGELVTRAPAADLLHLAAHAVAHTANPQAARLFLAPDTEGGSGSMATVEIASLRLARAPLVVLSACSTARGPAGSLEGRLDLARPFLAAGAGAVVAALWEVEDDEARAFFTAFHRAYARSHDHAAALRQAQIEMLQSPEPGLRRPGAWAGYQAVGTLGRR